MADLLYVEDDAAFRAVYAEVLRQAGFQVWEASTAEAALEHVAEQVPALVLLDLSLPPGGMSGIALLEQLRIRHVAVPIVVFTGYGDILDPEVLHRLGATAVVAKGRVLADDLIVILKGLLEARGAA